MDNTAYRGKIFEVIERVVADGGKEKTLEFARRSPGVRLIIPDNGNILVTKEFRHEINGYDHRLPGGKVFDTLDEYRSMRDSGADITSAAREAAVKEAREEAGIDVKGLSLFHTSICGATIEWDLYYFVVSEFERTTQALEDGEDIAVEFVPSETAREMCLNGTMGEERSALVLLRFLRGRT